MNLTMFIAEECANHRCNGSCLGMPALTQRGSKIFPADKCRVAEGKRCQYFEACVMPLAVEMGAPHLVDEYQNKTNSMILGSSARAHVEMRTCGCGTPLAARQRTCDRCQAKKRREARHQTTDNRDDSGARIAL